MRAAAPFRKVKVGEWNLQVIAPFDFSAAFDHKYMRQVGLGELRNGGQLALGAQTFYGESYCRDLVALLHARLARDERYLIRLAEEVNSRITEFKAEYGRLLRQVTPETTPAELAAIVHELQERLRLLLATFAYFGEPTLETVVKQRLDEWIASNLSMDAELLTKLPEVLAPESTTELQEDQLAALEIAAKLGELLSQGVPASEALASQEIAGGIDAHATKYAWLGTYCYAGHDYPREHFTESIAAEAETARRKLELRKSEAARRAALRRRIIAESARPEETELLVRAIQDLAHARMARIEAVNEYSSRFNALVKPAFCKFTSCPPESFNSLTLAEMSAVLEGTAKLDETTLEERAKCFAAFYWEGTGFVLGGEDARKAARKLAGEESHSSNAITGVKTNGGKARGPARVILGGETPKEFTAGDILVTTMTEPNLVVFMKKAAAIVTDQGGLLCHAAIVSRELGKPCVTGTRIATKAIKNGDLIEVDADNGKITILERAAN